MAMLNVREYLEEDGTSPVAEWFAALDATAAAKITVVLARIEQGKLSNVKGVGEGAGVPAGFRAGLPGVFRP
jgi:putative component of toxin-antitoxin plasmid stabilization module